MASLTSVLDQLKLERASLASQLESLNNAISALSVKGASGRVSAAGRARIAAAQRARWARLKGKKLVSITAPKRTMSAAARRRIAAAQKARWSTMAAGTKDGVRMQFDLQTCRHQRKRPPDLVTDTEGVFYLVFECVLCGCRISLRLDSEGDIDGEFIVPPERKRA